MSTYRNAMGGKHKEGTFYLLAFTSAEERGGTSKPSGLYVADKIEDFPSRKDCYGATIFEVRNGALFEVGSEEEEYDAKGNNKGKWVVDSTWDPDGCQWWDIWDDVDPEDIWDDVDPEDSEDDPEETPGNFTKGYVVIRTTWNPNGSLKGRKIALTKRWTKAFGNLVADESPQLDVYRLENGEARLIVSNASVMCFTHVDSTGFSQYDHALNPYKACQHNCAYCYAGGYRDFTDLPEKHEGRIAIGTHTDPYQAVELKEHRTEWLLKDLAKRKGITKVGIFTKSPLITRDIELIKALPNPHVHLNLSPFSNKWRTILEKDTYYNAERASVIEPLQKAGIKVVLNVCPCIPGISDPIMTDPVMTDAYEKADEICIGLLCLYGNVQDKVRELLPDDVLEQLDTRTWEDKFIKLCRKAIGKKIMNRKIVIWRDRTRTGWKLLSDLTPLPQEFYAEHKSHTQDKMDLWLARQFQGRLKKDEVMTYGKRFGGKLDEYGLAITFVRDDLVLQFVGPRLGCKPDRYSREGSVVKLKKDRYYDSDAEYLVTKEQIEEAISRKPKKKRKKAKK